MSDLAAVFCMAPNSEYIFGAAMEWLRSRAGTEGRRWRADGAGSWAERFARLLEGEAQMGWICGAQYVRAVDAGAALIPVAAPVWRSSQYRDAPVYFSQMVVRADSPFTGWDALRGARLAINQRASYSGCDSVRVELANRGEGGDFFGAVVESGSHEQSLAAVLQGAADVAAIDSTVLEEAVRRDATLAARLRTVQLLGPAAMPPWVLTAQLSEAERRALQEALCTMHAHAEGRQALEQTPVARFAAVDDSTYDAVRRDLLRAASVAL